MDHHRRIVEADGPALPEEGLVDAQPSQGHVRSGEGVRASIRGQEFTGTPIAGAFAPGEALQRPGLEGNVEKTLGFEDRLGRATALSYLRYPSRITEGDTQLAE
jgi:hypothetical protein